MFKKYKYISIAFLFAFALTAHTFEHEFADLQDDNTTYPMDSLKELATFADTLAEEYPILIAKRFHVPKNSQPFSFSSGSLTGSLTLDSNQFIDAHLLLRHQKNDHDIYIDQKRRMKNNQINYIDHKNIGIFIVYNRQKEEKKDG